MIPYTLKHSQRAQQMIIRISKRRTLEVVVPIKLSIELGIKLLYDNVAWVEKNLHLLDLELFKYYWRGKELTLNYSKSDSMRNHHVQVTDNEVIIQSPSNTDMSPFDVYMIFLKIHAKKILPERCRELAKQFNFNPAKISVRGQKTRWGSCSSRGTISLNSRLMQLSQPLIDYLIIHELCHLRHPNHSAKFWAEVEKYIPNYRTLDSQLSRFKQ